MEIPIGINVPDQLAVDSYGQALVDSVYTETGVRARPGATVAIDLLSNSPVDGMYGWVEQNMVVAICNGAVYSISESSFVPESSILLEDGSEILLEDSSGVLMIEPIAVSSDISGDTVGTGRCSFANFGDYLFFSCAGKVYELHPSAAYVEHSGTDYVCIKNCIGVEPGVTSGWGDYWTSAGTGGGYDAWSEYTRYGSGVAELHESPNIPETVTCIATIDGYLLALESGSGRMHFSVVLEPWNFDADWITAEYLPDNANNMVVYNGEIWISGSNSIESFVNDGSTPFVRSGYGGITHGVSAPLSFIPVDGNFIFIDDSRRLVSLNGREVATVSHSIDTYINDLSRIEDAVAECIVVDAIKYYILRFPLENKCLSVNLGNMSWSEWAYRPDGDNLTYNATCFAEMPAWGVVISGGADGMISIIDSGVNYDNETRVLSLIRSPRMQTPRTITAGKIIVWLTKVNRTNEVNSSSLGVRWRDDGGDWKNWRTVEFDDSETDRVIHINRCGAYRYNRQYELDTSLLWPYAIQRVEQL